MRTAQGPRLCLVLLSLSLCVCSSFNHALFVLELSRSKKGDHQLAGRMRRHAQETAHLRQSVRGRGPSAERFQVPMRTHPSPSTRGGTGRQERREGGVKNKVAAKARRERSMRGKRKERACVGPGDRQGSMKIRAMQRAAALARSMDSAGWFFLLGSSFFPLLFSPSIRLLCPFFFSFFFLSPLTPHVGPLDSFGSLTCVIAPGYPSGTP